MEEQDYFEKSNNSNTIRPFSADAPTAPLSPQNEQRPLEMTQKQLLIGDDVDDYTDPDEEEDPKTPFAQLNSQNPQRSDQHSGLKATAAPNSYQNLELPPINPASKFQLAKIESIENLDSVSSMSCKAPDTKPMQEYTDMKIELPDLKPSKQVVVPQQEQPTNNASFEGRIKTPPIEQTIQEDDPTSLKPLKSAKTGFAALISDKKVSLYGAAMDGALPKASKSKTLGNQEQPAGGSASLFSKMMNKNLNVGEEPEQNESTSTDNESIVSVQFSEGVFADENQTTKKKEKPKPLFKDFTDQFAESGQKQKGCFILQDNKIKICWDVYVMVILILTTFIVPYRLAFIAEETQSWVLAYYFFDSMFAIDIVLCFFTSFTDDYKQIEVVNLRRIGLNYIMGWFLIDLMSILPFDAILDGNSNANALIRVARIGKMYKIVRLFRLVKILKLVKSNRRLVHHFSEKMKISNGLERLIFFSGFFIVFIHVFACLFVMMAELEKEFSSEVWLESCYGFGEKNMEFEMYLCSCYYVMTTTSTVGYGDISPKNSIERVFGCLLMFIGVLSFTFVSGALASILQSHDTREAVLQEKVLQLNKLRTMYPVTEELIQNIRNALNFDANKTDGYLEELYHDLPNGVKMELMMVVHDATFHQFPFFKNLGNRYFVTWISSMMKPRLTTPAQRIYSEGDEIDDFYFMTKGVAAFIKEKQNNTILGVVDPLKVLQMQTKAAKMKVFQSFGCEDSVYNHLHMLIEIEKGKQAEVQKQGENALNIRRFSVECMSTGEYLTLNYSMLDKMKKNFQSPSRKFFKFIIDQFRQLLTYNCFCVAKFQEKMMDKKFQKRLLNQTAESSQNYMKESAHRLNKYTHEWNMALHEQSDRMSTLHWSSSDEEQDNILGLVGTTDMSAAALQGGLKGILGGMAPQRSESSPIVVQPMRSQTQSESGSQGFVLQRQGRTSVVSPTNDSQRMIDLETPLSMQPRRRMTTVLGQPPAINPYRTSQTSDTMNQIAAQTKGLSGHQALAAVLSLATADKKKTQLSLADKIKQQMANKMKAGLYEVELLKNLKTKKLQILENLIAEQDFRVGLNSMNPQERALETFAAKQEMLIVQMGQKLSHQMSLMKEDLAETNRKVDEIQSSLLEQ